MSNISFMIVSRILQSRKSQQGTNNITKRYVTSSCVNNLRNYVPWKLLKCQMYAVIFAHIFVAVVTWPLWTSLAKAILGGDHMHTCDGVPKTVSLSLTGVAL